MILPKPSGSYQVGTQIFNWVDPERTETFSNTSSAHRELVVQIWYPTKINGKSRKYAEEFLDLWQEGLRKKGFPEQDIPEIEAIHSYEILAAPIAKEECPYPIIFFCHGYAAMRFAYSSFIQELASHGYIVVGIGHTYYAQIIKLLNGTIIHSAPESGSQTNLIDEKSSQIQQQIWINDLDFTLSKLKELNEDEQFLNCFDFNRMGIAGHSFGGSTAIQLARLREYIKAAVDLDGALFGPKAIDGFNKPIMFLLGQKTLQNFKHHTDEDIAKHLGWPKELIAVLRNKYTQYIPELISNMSAPVYYFEIPNADHGAFTDWAILKDLSLYKNNKNIYNIESSTGVINGQNTVKIINQYLLAFFNTYLKNEKVGILGTIKIK